MPAWSRRNDLVSFPGKLVSSTVVLPGNSRYVEVDITPSSDIGSCYAQSRSGYYGINEGFCCVCAVR